MIAEKLLTVHDVDDWQAVLPASASVFGSVEYARIYQELTGYEARLFLLESDDSLVAYPFFLRPIDSLPFASDMPEPFGDTLTPEFTGPIKRKSKRSSFGTHFAERFSKYCKEDHIVAEFAHLHPWNSGQGFLEPSQIELDREIVYVDLSLPEDELWQHSLTYACRKNIKRARRENVRVFQAKTSDDIQEFYRIYIHTMDRSQALDRYYYSLDFFMAFFERMPDNARFVLAEYRGKIVAVTLYLHDDTDVYSYLGGADYAFQQVRPTNAVVYETILWAQRQGKRRLILGGGYEPNDGIFRFKASFSPLRAQFFVYRHVHLPEAYGRLCRAWADHYQVHLPITESSNFFPVYRAVPDMRI